MTYYYTIVGADQFMLANYPPSTTAVRIWYVRSLPDIEMDSELDQILTPYAKKIASYAAKAAMLAAQDPEQFAAWSAEWRASLLDLTAGSSSRNEADPVFVQDFLG